MPPKTGLFNVPYGSGHNQSANGIATSSSMVGHGPGIMTHATLTGPGTSSGGPSGGKASRTIGGGGGGGVGMGTFSVPMDVVNGEAYPHQSIGPGQHPSHHSLPQHQQHPLAHNQHQHSHMMGHGSSQGAGSSRQHGQHEEGRKEKKRKDPSKLGKEVVDRRDDRNFLDNVNALHGLSHALITRPDVYSMFRLRLYPITMERSALLAQYESEERYAVELAQVAYDEERERVEDEWKRGREKVRERLLEGIEERRKRAREEKEGEGTSGDATLDSHSRPPITRKLRNKLGTSPPPTPLNVFANPLLPGATAAGGLASNLPITTGPFLNPHSLAVDELPSPFPLPLTHTSISNGGGAGGGGAGAGGAGAGGTGRRRAKGGGGHQGQAVGGLGKSLLIFNNTKDIELENDMNEIRRGNKRRRAAAGKS
ncbi:hypothetical protein CVT24_000707 [Panaeolus cyanescens]|uniref:Uncharacterized protein n=1 Tax=Panaeolus cyanescens TaxID=181874 RepID=A0A409YT36_9AGAR|nr:hypothetical protein CVT24_000707 [Panaeolus cyanescens]